MPELIPKWYEDANCANTDPEAFFADPTKDPEITALAKRVCLHCKVGELCLKYAMDNKLTKGIWGGMTANERAKLRRDNNRNGKV